ncbi:MAG: zinc-ribbon domain-containing protein [Candidatus Bathyarchaeia archaeon]
MSIEKEEVLPEDFDEIPEGGFFCLHCGYINPKTATFCLNCGKMPLYDPECFGVGGAGGLEG